MARLKATSLGEVSTSEQALQGEVQRWQRRAEENEAKLDAVMDELRRLQAQVRASSEAAAAPTDASASSAATGAAPDETAASKRMLHTRGLTLEPQLKDFWYPVDFSSRVDDATLVPLELFNVPWVLWRNKDGEVCCVKDSCAHRACPLSLGTVSDSGCIQCPYHGWEYDRDGQCTKMPSTPHAKGVELDSLPVKEADGFVWVYPGDPSRAGDAPLPSLLPEGENFEQHASIQLDVPVEHGLLMENLLDLSHAPFTHTSTFAKGWPVPDSVKFHMEAGMGIVNGTWDPYPIDMQFVEPCFVVSTIGLAAPGEIIRGVRAKDCDKHLRQVHACIPAKDGSTRLLYLMHLDFWPFLKKLPGMEAMWASQASQVLGEDLRLVEGQQERELAGQGDVWGAPVAYDAVAVRYRRWRNQLASCDEVKCDVAQEDPLP